MSSSLELVLPTYTGSFVTEEDREWLEESIDERSYVTIEQLMGTAATQPWFAYDDIRIWRADRLGNYYDEYPVQFYLYFTTLFLTVIATSH